MLIRTSLARGVLRADRFVGKNGRLPDSLAEFADGDFPGPDAANLFGPRGPEYRKTPTGFLLQVADPTFIPLATAANTFQIEVSYHPGRMPKGTAKP
jgi:hypothetical protein